jgi:hypothetical protein
MGVAMLSELQQQLIAAHAATLTAYGFSELVWFEGDRIAHLDGKGTYRSERVGIECKTERTTLNDTPIEVVTNFKGARGTDTYAIVRDVVGGAMLPGGSPGLATADLPALGAKHGFSRHVTSVIKYHSNSHCLVDTAELQAWLKANHAGMREPKWTQEGGQDWHNLLAFVPFRDLIHQPVVANWNKDISAHIKAAEARQAAAILAELKAQGLDFTETGGTDAVPGSH